MMVCDCKYFRYIHYIDTGEYALTKTCDSPYKCTYKCPENPDLRYRTNEGDESESEGDN